MFWVHDPKTAKPSVTLTAFMLGFIVAVFKLGLSGVTLGSLHFDPFSGADFAAVVGALGGIYVLRRHSDSGRKTDCSSGTPPQAS